MQREVRTHLSGRIQALRFQSSNFIHHKLLSSSGRKTERRAMNKIAGLQQILRAKQPRVMPPQRELFVT